MDIYLLAVFVISLHLLWIIGRSHTTTESYQVKVVTHREYEAFEFSQFRDIAPPSINLEDKKATRVGYIINYKYYFHVGKSWLDQRFVW